ncbi:MAG TPA: DUF1080 domain-containing protein [Acidimicrobiales bacterium]|nr:DUF1080 domain-containing protein [Acidimicrobiales bacterium]
MIRAKLMMGAAVGFAGLVANLIPGAHAFAAPKWKSGGGTTSGGTTSGGTTSGGTSTSSGTVLFSDGFESLPLGTGWLDGSVHGNWTSVYNGYGQNGIALDGTNVLSLSPAVSTTASTTHAGLVTSVPSFGDMDLKVQVRTVAQLRQPAPNPWEVGWVQWHYTDDNHFYYLILKPNGWELGKEYLDSSGAQNQQFLATGSSPTYPVGQWNKVEIKQVSNAITVWANGTQLATYTDTQNPYLKGVIGLYSEDSTVHFDNVQVSSAS